MGVISHLLGTMDIDIPVILPSIRPAICHDEGWWRGYPEKSTHDNFRFHLKKKQKLVPLFHPFLAREKKNTPKPVTTLYSQKLPSWLLIGCSLDDTHQPVLHPYILRGSLIPQFQHCTARKKSLKIILLQHVCCFFGNFLPKKKIPFHDLFPSWEGFLFSTHFFTTHFDKTWTCSSYVGKETSICTSEKVPRQNTLSQRWLG